MQSDSLSPVSQDGTALFVRFGRMVFEVDLETARARFLVTIAANPNFVHVSEFGVVWGEDWCDRDPSNVRTLIYERDTGSITEFGGAFATRLDPGRALVRNHVVQAIIDLDTLEYIMVLPETSGGVE